VFFRTNIKYLLNAHYKEESNSKIKTEMQTYSLSLKGATLFATLNILNHSVSDKNNPAYAPALQAIPHLSHMGLIPFSSVLDITQDCFVLPLLSKFIKNQFGQFAVHFPSLNKFSCFDVLAIKFGYFSFIFNSLSMVLFS
jgi:hypothetical protein